jgi:hypothetical protein
MMTIPFTFLELYQLHRFKAEELAHEAQVPAAIVDLMLQGLPVPRESARQVLKTLSLQTGHYYTFNTVAVTLTEGSK